MTIVSQYQQGTFAVYKTPIRTGGKPHCSHQEQRAFILPARRYASASTSYDPVSVCSSVTSRYCIETTSRIKLIFGMEASFYLSHNVL